MIHEVVSIQVEGSSPDTKLYTYILDNSKDINPNLVRPLILICPGGGYAFTSDREAELLALQFVAKGFHAAVLRYSVAPAVYPTALLELAKSVVYLREHAKEYHIDPDKIVVEGASAGGHLAASYSCFWTKDFISETLKVDKSMFKPNGMMLLYPVITSGEFAHRGSFVNLLGSRYDELVEVMSLENCVNENTPKAFIWHTFTDGAVPVENSLYLVSSLRKNNIPTEFHMYPVGGHGLSLANELTMDSNGGAIQEECQSWIDLALTWMKHL